MPFVYLNFFINILKYYFYGKGCWRNDFLAGVCCWMRCSDSVRRTTELGTIRAHYQSEEERLPPIRQRVRVTLRWHIPCNHISSDYSSCPRGLVLRDTGSEGSRPVLQIKFIWKDKIQKQSLKIIILGDRVADCHFYCLAKSQILINGCLFRKDPKQNRSWNRLNFPLKDFMQDLFIALCLLFLVEDSKIQLLLTKCRS